MSDLTILKLGGSAITDKAKELTPDLVTIHRSADHVASFQRPLILLHGGGSFAHPFASRARLQNGYSRPEQLRGLAETELYLEQLARMLLVALLQRGVPAIRIHPLSCIQTRNGNVAVSFLDAFRDCLRLGVLPLSHGDVVFDSKKGFSVLSADRLAFLLGTRFKASRVLFGSDVDGVYSHDPKMNEESSLIPQVTRSNISEVIRSLRERPGRNRLDVTKGMLGKVLAARDLARKGCETVIFNLHREGLLEQMLSQGSQNDWDENIVCTRFLGWTRRRT